ncbi:hypothetical protein BLNAU_21357 [Blattamonas nauphoetae]|uniref:Uncharacterized protein n=1 Tax=Blattamonas nauphoetae TaxID=2049346 RepID=A0ABQ9WZ66_9EUKA|nr:hypothetical protein BLNAU_21357 [Blattamonas nauphoetae]
MSQEDLLLPVFEDHPREFIIKDRHRLKVPDIKHFLQEKGVNNPVLSQNQPTDAYFTLKVDDSQPSMDAMTQLLNDGPCVAVHTSNSLCDYPVTILPRLAPKSLLFTTDTLTLSHFWDSPQTTLPQNVTILPLPQYDGSDASVVIFSDRETIKRVHESFPKVFARFYPNQDHFGNVIKMEITAFSLPSKDLSCDEKATIVNLLNPTISEEITKAIQPHFPVVEAKALLVWKNILDAIKSTFNSSEGEGTKDDSTVKKTCFKVRLTPFLFVHCHINEIATVLNCEFRIVRSLGNIGGDVSFTFKFATLSPMKLVKDTVKSQTSHQSPPCIQQQETDPYQSLRLCLHGPLHCLLFLRVLGTRLLQPWSPPLATSSLSSKPQMSPVALTPSLSRLLILLRPDPIIPPSPLPAPLIRDSIQKRPHSFPDAHNKLQLPTLPQVPPSPTQLSPFPFFSQIM